MSRRSAPFTVASNGSDPARRAVCRRLIAVVGRLACFRTGFFLVIGPHASNEGNTLPWWKVEAQVVDG